MTLFRIEYFLVGEHLDTVLVDAVDEDQAVADAAEKTTHADEATRIVVSTVPTQVSA